MSNRPRLKTAAHVRCLSCGLLFPGDYELQMHYKHLPGNKVCISLPTMREILGFYWSRGAWRLAGRRAV